MMAAYNNVVSVEIVSSDLVWDIYIFYHVFLLRCNLCTAECVYDVWSLIDFDKCLYSGNLHSIKTEKHFSTMSYLKPLSSQSSLFLPHTKFEIYF